MKIILNDFKKLVKDKKNTKVISALLLLGIFFGFIVSSLFTTSVSEQQLQMARHDHIHHQNSKNSKNEKSHSKIRYTCSMHPQINKGKPGKCPICGMTLIPIDSGEDVVGEEGRNNDQKYTVKLSKYALKIAEVQTASVERKILSQQIKLVGKIDYDETRFANLTAWFPGRVEKMYVDYTGIKVNKGDHLVKIYSPELLSAQEELLSAKRAIRKSSKSTFSSIKNLNRATLSDVRNKLKLWGMTAKQIKNIERRKKTSRTMTIYSPVNGVVIKKSINDGMYVKTGSNIYSIADLDHLWVKLDAYESDIAKIRFGQKVVFYAESYPGKKFIGKVSFIDPVLDKDTQSIKVRVNVANKEGLLRPGMFVHATVMAKMSNHGVVMDKVMLGKFTCPMHPEVLKDKKGVCPICGMDLVKTETLGFHNSFKNDQNNQNNGSDNDIPLVIPVTAPLLTGERSVVYVALGNGKFGGRVVELGARVGDFYIVKSGLREGEDVVTNGNFKIDSSAQIMTKKSMMNPLGGGPAVGMHMDMGGKKKKNGKMKMKMKTKMKMKMPMPMPSIQSKPKSHHIHKRFVTSKQFMNSLDDIYKTYLVIHKDLSNDKIKDMPKLTNELTTALVKVDMSLLKGESHKIWMKILSDFKKNIKVISKSKSIIEVREYFKGLSNDVDELKQHFGVSKNVTLKRYYCPMVKSYWLQSEDHTLNPYFGQSMLTCGQQK